MAEREDTKSPSAPGMLFVIIGWFDWTNWLDEKQWMRYVGRGGVAAGVVWVRERRMKSGCGEGCFVLVSTGATRDVMDALQLSRSDGTK